MKLKTGKLVDTFGALMQLANLDMPPDVAIKVQRVVKVAKIEHDTFQTVLHSAAGKCGGMMQQEGEMQFYQFPNTAARKEFEETMKPGREIEIELPGDPLTEADITKLKTIKPALLTDLSWLITL